MHCVLSWAAFSRAGEEEDHDKEKSAPVSGRHLAVSQADCVSSVLLLQDEGRE